MVDFSSKKRNENEMKRNESKVNGKGEQTESNEMNRNLQAEETSVMTELH